ncbi:MAG: hypothetical protein U5K00_16645 [Melioribacteraceae bacterium]|nr:hypothetical protein [Melioribacteraceae bacterium]
MGSKINFKLTVLFLLVLLTVLGCGDEDSQEARSMGDIQDEKGIPVVVKEVKHEHFKKSSLSFHR